MRNRTPFSNEGLPSATFVRQVGAIREGGFCVRDAALSPDFDAPEDSGKAKISLIHRRRRLTATLSLAAVLNMMAVPMIGATAYATVASASGNVIEVSGNETSARFTVTGGAAYSSSGSSYTGSVLDLLSGSAASATSAIINSGGIEHVRDGALDTSAVINSGGEQNVYSGGSAVGAVVSAGGVQNVGLGNATSNTTSSAGGSTISGTIYGTQNIWSGGVDSSGTVTGASGAQNIYSGGTAVETSIVSGGHQHVFNGGSAASATIGNSGHQTLYSGAVASDTTLAAGGTQNLMSGVSVSSGDYSGSLGGVQNVHSGAVASGLTFSGSAAAQHILDGGSASGTVLESGAKQNVSGGTVTSTTVSSGSEQNIYGGSATGDAISGVQNVHGGEVVSTVVSTGGVQNISGGKVTSATVSGSQNVYGGSAVAAVIATGGIQNVSGGEVVSAAVSSGTQNIHGGTVTSTVITTSGIQNVSGGEAKATTVTSGSQVIFGGGLATSTVIATNGTMVVSGGEAVAALISGSATVKSGGTVTDMTLAAGSATFDSGGIMAGFGNVVKTSNLLGNVTMKDDATKLLLDTSSSDITVSAAIKGPGTITVSGGSSGIMSAVNSGFNGVIDVKNGAIVGSANYALGSGALVKANSGANVDYATYSAVVRGLEGEGSQSAGSGLTITLDNSTHVVDGALTVAGKLIVTGGAAVTPLLARAAVAPLAATTIAGGMQVFDGSGNTASAVEVQPGGVMVVGGSLAEGSSATFETSSGASGGFTASGAGATIGGYGTLLTGDVTITNGAVLAPGLAENSTDETIGQLTISGGDLTITSGVLQAKLNTNSSGGLIHDQVVVSGGSASMTNTNVELSVVGDEAKVAEAIIADGDLGSIITATGGVTATNNTVEFVDTSLLTGSVTSDGQITVDMSDLSDVDGVSGNNNRNAVYGGIKGNTGLMAEMFKLGTDAGKISQAVDSLTGEVYAAAAAQAQGAQLSLGRQMLGRLAGFHNPGYAPPAGDEDGPHNLWFSFGASRGTIDGDDKIGTAEADTQRVDTALGYHHSLDNGWAVGAALQFGWAEVDVDDRWSNSDIDSLGFTLYGTKAVPTGLGDLRFTFGGNYTHYTVDVERRAMLTTPQHLTGHQSGDGYGLFAEAAHRFQLSEGLDSGIFLEPFLGLQYNALKMDSLTESGGNAALEMDADKMDNFSTDLGLRLVGDVSEAVSLNGSLSWAHNFGDVETWTKTRFVDGGNAFKIQGNSASENELNIGLGATFHIGEGTGITVGYDGVIGDNSHSHGGHAVLDIRW